MDALLAGVVALCIVVAVVVVARVFDHAVRQSRRATAPAYDNGNATTTAAQVRREVADLRRTLRDDADEFERRGGGGR